MNKWERLFNRLIEQEEVPPEEEAPVEEAPPKEAAPPTPADPQEGDIGAEAPPGAAPDAAAEEMPPEEIIDRTDIGKLYQLKKLYTRLVSISNVLEYITDPKLDNIKLKVIESIDLFNVVIDNYQKFKEDVEDILTKYTKFIVEITDKIEGARV